ncbi:MAG: hypothetical protein D6772_12505, partial [Bacteroidetes bacterium]
EQFIKHYEYQLPDQQKCYYRIQTPIPKKQRDETNKYNDGNTQEALRKTYELEIDSVVLHLYYTGVGVLSFHLNNRKYREPEDILYINQYGRRVFPAFYPIPEKLVGTQAAFDYQYITELPDDEVNRRKYHPHGKELAYFIEVEIPGHPQNDTGRFVETWPDPPHKLWQAHKSLHFPLPAFLQPFLEPLERPSGQKVAYHIKPVLDDRMFVVCWYGNKYLSEHIIPSFDYQDFCNGNRASTDWWYKYVFMDAEDLTVQNDTMRRELLAKASYVRWSGYGTWYGITDYSLVLLTGELAHLRQNYVNASYLVTHLQTIYFRLAELTLVQRACTQKFSDDVTVISGLHKNQEIQLAKHVNALYKRYIRFVNRIFFREVTAQVQGIELYDLLHRQSRLREAVKNLNEEIHELHSYVRQEADRIGMERDQQLQNSLTILSAVFVAPGLVIATYDLGFLTDCLDESLRVGSLLITVFMATVSASLAWWALKTKQNWHRWLARITFVAILLLPALAIHCGYCSHSGAPAESENLNVSPLPTPDTLSVPLDSQIISTDSLSPQK